MINRKLIGITTLTLVLLVSVSIRVKAYNEDIGLETGDVIEIEFDAKIIGGSRDGEFAIPNKNSILELTPAAMISGLYETLLGMKIDEIKKNVIISPEKGFTETSHELYNQTLNYNIQVLQLIHNNIFSSSSSQEVKSRLFDEIVYYTSIILVLFSMSYFIILIKQRMRKYSLKMCSYCNNIADGKCGKCGTMSCRISFSAGCLNCKGNTFLAIKTTKK